MERKPRVGIFYAVIVVLVIVVLILAIAPSASNQAAEDCLRGNNSACVYFQAQEEVGRAQQELDAAKEVLATARAEYKNTKSDN